MQLFRFLVFLSLVTKTYYVTQFTCKRRGIVLVQRPKPRPGAQRNLVWSTDVFQSSRLYHLPQYHQTYYLLSWSNLREEDFKEERLMTIMKYKYFPLEKQKGLYD